MSDFLKCDAAGCDHFELTPVTIDVVDKPCPKCGANLCTKEDFVIFKSLTAVSKAMNEVALKFDPDTPMQMVAVNVHDGQIRTVVDPSPAGNPFPNGA